MKPLTTLLKVSTLSVALLGTVAVAAVLVAPDFAYAGKGNDNGGGKGGGNGAKSDNGKGGGKGGSAGQASGAKAKAGGSSKGKTAKGNSRQSKFSVENLFGLKSNTHAKRTSTTTKKVSAGQSAKPLKAATSRAPKMTETPAAKPKGNRLAAALGVHPSELGALNAANASPQALANASPNSRVGKLAIYAEEVRATAALQDELDLAQAELDLLEAPTRSLEEIDGAIEAATQDRSALEAELASLNQALSDAGGADPEIESEIARVEGELGTANTTLVDLEQERLDGEAYFTAAEEVERLQEELDGQTAEQRAALEAAANKEVTDDIELAVQHMLGLIDEEIASSN